MSKVHVAAKTNKALIMTIIVYMAISYNFVQTEYLCSYYVATCSHNKIAIPTQP